jgi:hypothetical protein
MNHDSSNNVRIIAAEALVGVHGDIQEAIWISIGTASTISSSGKVDNSDLSNIQDFTDILNECLGSEATDRTTVVGSVQSTVGRTGEDCAITSVVEPVYKSAIRQWY